MASAGPGIVAGSSGTVEVPTAAHWRQFVVAPDDFDAGPSGLWKVVQKLVDEKGKQTWKCVFCSRCFNSWHATKVLFHLAKAPGGDIQACLASAPAWLVEAGRAKVAEMATKKKQKALAKAAVDSASDERLLSVGASVQNGRKRSSASASRETSNMGDDGDGGGEAPIFRAMGVSTSTALSAAIAELVHADGLSNALAQSPRLAKVLKLARSVPTKQATTSSSSLIKEFFPPAVHRGSLPPQEPTGAPFSPHDYITVFFFPILRRFTVPTPEFPELL